MCEGHRVGEEEAGEGSVAELSCAQKGNIVAFVGIDTLVFPRRATTRWWPASAEPRRATGGSTKVDACLGQQERDSVRMADDRGSVDGGVVVRSRIDAIVSEKAGNDARRGGVIISCMRLRAQVGRDAGV